MSVFEIIHAMTDFMNLMMIYLGQVVRDTIFVLELLGSFFTHIPSYFSWLPGSLVSVLVTLISIVIVYKVLGREG